MRLFTNILFVIIFLFLSYFSLAQTNEIDSLENKLSVKQDDTAKIVILNELAMKFYNNNPKKSLEYSTKALKISKNSNYIKHLPDTYSALAAANWILGNYDISLDYLFEKLKIHEINNEQYNIAKTYKHIGVILNEYDKDSLALTYLHNSLDIYKELKDNVGIADAYTVIATIYYKNRRLAEAEDYWRKASRIYEDEKEILKAAYNEHNLGLFFYEEGNYTEALKSFNYTLQKCSENKQLLCFTTVMSSIGSVYIKMQKYDLAEKYFLQLIDTAQKYSMSKVEMETFFILAELDTIRNNYKSAFNRFIKYTELKDSLFTQEKEKKISELQILYETKKTKQENILLYKAKKKNKLIALTLGIALLSVILMLLFMRKTIRIKQSNNILLLQKNNEILLQKDKISKTNKELIKYFTIIEQTPVSIIITNTKGETEYVNPFFTKTTGYTLDQITGKNMNILKTNKTLPDIYIELWNTITKGEAWIGEFTNRKKNGKEFIERAIITPIKNEKSEIVNYVGIKEDITNKKELEIKFIKEQQNLEYAHKNITDSINYARRIQNAVFPENNFFEQSFSDYFVFFQPLDIVSGDFYWAKKFKEYIIFTVADCTGHGVPGAFVSILGISLLNEISLNTKIISAGNILDNLRDRIKSTLHQNTANNKDGMDISLCVLNTKTNELQFAGANNSMYIVRNTGDNTTELSVIQADRQPIGVYVNEKSFSNQKIQLKKGDILYLFTDGYSDQFNGKTQKKFKKHRFEELISAISQKSLREQHQIIETTYLDWKNDADQVDDILILGLKI